MSSAFTPVAVRTMTSYGGPDPSTGEARFFLLRLEHPRGADGQPLWRGWKPGQFAMLRPAGWCLDLPWARPLSICDVDDEELTFFFQVVGRGTGRMASLKPGDVIHLWGPLGNGFVVEPDTPALLLGGGIGLAPFVGYCRMHAKPDTLRLLFSHRPDSSAYPLELFTSVNVEDHPENSLEDRAGFLEEVRTSIHAMAEKNGLVLACGPTPFLAFVRDAALASGCRAQLSLENRMACGVGACLGCVTRPTEAHPIGGKDMLPLRTCVNGPVFWADQVDLEGA